MTLPLFLCSVKTKRPNQWCFCHMLNAAWHNTSWFNWRLHITIDFFRPNLVSHTKDALVQFSLSCLCILIHTHIYHIITYFITNILQYFMNIDTLFLDICCLQLMGMAFIVHFFTHIAAVTIDPADASVRAKQNYSGPVPLFDRTKQPHVIQDLHCYLCDIKVYVSKRVKYVCF